MASTVSKRPLELKRIETEDPLLDDEIDQQVQNLKLTHTPREYQVSHQL